MNPGWYRSKTDPSVAEFWDGEQWTGDTRVIGPASPAADAPSPANNDASSLPPSPAAMRPAGQFPGEVWGPPSVSPSSANAGFPPGRGATYSGQQKRRSGMPTWAVTLIVLAVSGLVIISGLAFIGMSTFSNARSGARDASVKTDLNYTAKNLESFYTDNGGYPSESMLTDNFFRLAPGNTVSVAYYGSTGEPTGYSNAVSYVMCGFNSTSGKAFAYDSANGGLTFPGVDSVGEGESVAGPCDTVAEFTASGDTPVIWNPNDMDFALTFNGSVSGPADVDEGSVVEDAGSWTGLNLEGETVTLVEGVDTEFVDGVPVAVVAVDKAYDLKGCAGIITEGNYWADVYENPDFEKSFREEASVYAKYIIDLANEYGCLE